MKQDDANRRTFLAKTSMSAITLAAGLAGVQSPAVAASYPSVSIDPVHKPGIDVPELSCDGHVHIFDPTRFPYVAERTYTPPSATVDDLLAFQSRLGMQRAVLVQPSGYGTDNRCLLNALQRLGYKRARGVAVIDPEQVDDAELQRLHSAGVRAIRLNLEVRGGLDAGRFRSLLKLALERIRAMRWAVQIYTGAELIEQVADDLGAASSPIVLDHFGGLRAERGPQQPGYAALLELSKGGNVYVKLSAPYRASKRADFSDVGVLARALVDAAPQRMVWASDWPHTGSSANRSGDLSQIEPFRSIDDGHVLDLFGAWVADPELRHAILVDNPARLFQFDA